MRHLTLLAEPGEFFGWPANNGLWSWDGGREILVGCVRGAYDREGNFHSIRPPYTHLFLRSLDGGDTWSLECPAGLLTGGDDVPLERPLDFTHPGLALRIFGDGYHGSEDPRGGFYVSFDRGHAWFGPFRFAGLEISPPAAGRILTPRTAYLLPGPSEGLFFLSARPDHKFTDRVFCARTRDGGMSFEFVSWVVPPADPFRAVMPAPVVSGAGNWVCAVRRRAAPEDRCWIDAYHSGDHGATWSLLSRVGETGDANGNPPALCALGENRLCCVYGRRDQRRMVARLSSDGGQSWAEEVILRDDFHGERADFGYPRLVRRPDARLMAFYYWASPEHPAQHIAATIFDPTEM